jgi:hypothetical protein
MVTCELVAVGALPCDTLAVKVAVHVPAGSVVATRHVPAAAVPLTSRMGSAVPAIVAVTA